MAKAQVAAAQRAAAQGLIPAEIPLAMAAMVQPLELTLVLMAKLELVAAGQAQTRPVGAVMALLIPAALVGVMVPRVEMELGQVGMALAPGAVTQALALAMATALEEALETAPALMVQQAGVLVALMVAAMAAPQAALVGAMVAAVKAAAVTVATEAAVAVECYLALETRAGQRGGRYSPVINSSQETKPFQR